MSHSLRLDELFSLNGRVALVTGGGTGIGWMIAEGFAVNGARVYITGRRQDVLEKAAAKFAEEHKGNGAIIPIVMNVTDKQSILSAQEIIASKEGRLHILVNNAGQIGPLTPWFNDMSSPQHKDPETLGRALFDSASYTDWTGVFGVNTFALYFITTAFLGLLAKGSEDVPEYTSSVINITSISGNIKIAQNQFAYNTTKAAATHLTKMFATELALKKIPVRVCSVAPGIYESEMTHTTISPDEVDKLGKPIVPTPAHRAGTAQEMAGTVIYLVSPAGCYTNGQEIIIDGGYTSVNPSVR